uniref:Ground-like domain-containing protein n=1 Tax=Panagrolaimus sp. JU765 TaxID=591449 RepID=A0AC34Q5Q9_9BILA
MNLLLWKFEFNLIYLTVLFTPLNGLFFGSGSGCQCCPLPPPCPVQPVCVPVYTPCVEYVNYVDYYPSQDCCSSCEIPCRVKRIVLKKRQKRQSALKELPDEKFFRGIESDKSGNPKCNSERLRKIIKMSVGIETSVTKRNIQLLAEKHYHHKYNVVCSSEGDFSYITSTNEYCQENVNGKTCYVFRHFNRTDSNQ